MARLGPVNTALRNATPALRAKFLTLLERSNARYSLVGNTALIDPQQFPWSKALESNWRVIREELVALLPRVHDLPDTMALQHTFKPQDGQATSDLWKTFILYDYGSKNQKSCERCPKTTALIERIPSVVTALFSILGPKTHLPRHRGPYNGLLRYHLGLIVPKSGTCHIQVGTSFAKWEEGKSIAFDDSFPHEVWNDTDEYRAVLFLDVIRPLPFPLSVANRAAIRQMGRWQFVRNVRANYEQWEQQIL
jgi:aspartyl/asparaginyl beta-hydroxylase (cupin superfamily)